MEQLIVAHALSNLKLTGRNRMMRICKMINKVYNPTNDWRIKKAGHVDPLRFVARLLHPAMTLATNWNQPKIGTRMEAVKLYRRFSPRRFLYILSIPQPEIATNPVRIRFERGPPATKTH